jgi:DNA topoisomerase-1
VQPEELTLADALNLLAERASKGPSKPTRGKKAAPKAAKKAAPKTDEKRAAPKKKKAAKKKVEAAETTEADFEPPF